MLDFFDLRVLLMVWLIEVPIAEIGMPRMVVLA